MSDSEDFFNKATFSVSILFDDYTPGDSDDDDWSDHRCDAVTAGFEDADFETIKGYVRRYGISLAQDLEGPYPLFVSETPEENRDYFERGVERFYSMAIKTINGEWPSAQRRMMLAELMGVKVPQQVRNRHGERPSAT